MAGVDDGGEIICHAVFLLHVAEDDAGRGVVLVEEFSQCAAVVEGILQVLGSLGIVSLGNVQIAEGFAYLLGSGSLGNEVFGIFNVTVLEGHEAKVGIGFGDGFLRAGDVLEVFGSCGVVAFIELDDAYVVGGALVVGIDFGSLLVDGFLGISITLKTSSIEEFLDVELCGVALVLVFDLLVATAYYLVVDNHAGTAEFGQNAVGKLAETFAHVADLLLALIGVFIHREHAEDNILVLDVAGLYEFLEAFPVFSGVAAHDVGAHAFAEELLVHIVFGSKLTAVGEVIVEQESAFW